MDLPPAGPFQRWRAIGEVTGGWPRGYDLETDRYRAPLAARGGVRWHALPAASPSRWAAARGSGRRARPRGVAGLRRRPLVVRPGRRAGRATTTGDGVPNAKDQCPRDAGPGRARRLPGPRRRRDPGPRRQVPRPARARSRTTAARSREDEPLVEIETERLSLKDAIHFDTGKDTIKQESFRILDEVAKLLNEHAELKKVRVEGHTDNVGPAAYNKELSRAARALGRPLPRRRRAASTASGSSRWGTGSSGRSRPTRRAVGRSKNRRVEFTILSE